MTDGIKKLVDSFSAKITQPSGECFDASVSLGILLASHGLCTKLIKGTVIGRTRRYGRFRTKHWWLRYSSMGGTLRIDPTRHQFDVDIEYIEGEVHAMNFDSIAGYLDI